MRLTTHIRVSRLSGAISSVSSLGFRGVDMVRFFLDKVHAASAFRILY